MSETVGDAGKPAFRMPVWGWVLVAGLALAVTLHFVHVTGVVGVLLELLAGLMLGSVNVPETYGMGQVTLSGGATKPTSMTFNSEASAPTVSITATASGPVGDNAAGPAIALTGTVNNTGGSVKVTNSEGAFAQEGSINADSVVIDVPNASYIVNTPDDYFGTAGDIQD